MCQCNPHGSTTWQCNDNGDCNCKEGFTGPKCDTCKPLISGYKCDECYHNYYNYPSCQGLSKEYVICFLIFILSSISVCQCNSHGSTTLQCNDNGDCTCKQEFTGTKCNECKPNFTGIKCQSCKAGFYDYPSCKGLSN